MYCNLLVSIEYACKENDNVIKSCTTISKNNPWSTNKHTNHMALLCLLHPSNVTSDSCTNITHKKTTGQDEKNMDNEWHRTEKINQVPATQSEGIRLFRAHSPGSTAPSTRQSPPVWPSWLTGAQPLRDWTPGRFYTSRPLRCHGRINPMIAYTLDK
jgi:hypothetical protein